MDMSKTKEGGLTLKFDKEETQLVMTVIVGEPDPEEIIEEKKDPLKYLHGNTRLLLSELHQNFGDKAISRDDKLLKELRKRYYIPDFSQTLKIWEKRGLCSVHNNEHGHMDFFKLCLS